MRRLLPLLLAAVLAAGCAGDDDDEATPSPTTERRGAGTTTTVTAAAAPSTTVAAAPPTSAAPVPTPTPAPAGAPDAAALAAELAAAETAVRDPATQDGTRREQAMAAQRAYRQLVAHRAVLPAVLARVPAGLRRTVEANVTAGAELRALVKAPKPELPDWRIVSPAPAAELLSYYREAEAAFGVPWPYLAAIHLVETRMGRIRGTSEAGAQGPMQFLPSTWAAYGEGDIDSNRDSILAAARYLRRNGAPGNMDNALWNYNHSDRYVRAVNLYAREMQADERAYLGYYHWQVYYWHVSGDVLLPEGWTKS